MKKPMAASKARKPGADAALAAWDVLIVPFPYSDKLAEKRRPALAVSAPALAAAHGLVWAVMITSAKHAPWPEDVPIPDASAVGLPAASVVRTAKIACFDAARILRVAGRLAPAEQAAVTRRLAALLPMLSPAAAR